MEIVCTDEICLLNVRQTSATVCPWRTLEISKTHLDEMELQATANNLEQERRRWRTAMAAASVVAGVGDSGGKEPDRFHVHGKYMGSLIVLAIRGGGGDGAALLGSIGQVAGCN